jgi:hypothetical protein
VLRKKGFAYAKMLISKICANNKLRGKIVFLREEGKKRDVGKYIWRGARAIRRICNNREFFIWGQKFQKVEMII